MKQKIGISLIVLIITIIVVIILAAVVILTLSKNNPIESAKEARFKEDVRTFQDELALTVSKQYATAGGHRDEKISTSNFDEIKEYIPSFSEKYRDKFIIQYDELKYTEQLDEKEKKCSISLNVNKELLLPREFRAVEYLESTGTQFIDTNINFSDGLRFVFKCQWLELKEMNTRAFSTRFGANSNGNEIMLGYIYRNNKPTNYLGGNFGYTWQTNTDYEIILDLKNTSNDKLILTINNEKIREVNGNVNNKKCYLFGSISYHSVNTIDFYAKERFYYFKIYNGENEKLNLIPCYSTTTVADVNGKQCPSGTKGMYDTVEGKFYTNQGTGEFIPGPDVD